MSVRVFTCAEFRNNLDEATAQNIVKIFKEYKTTGIIPKNFGRDVAYDLVKSIQATGLRHIHVRDSTSTHWNLRTVQFHKTSDTALVYCQGNLDKNTYLLIAFFENAHKIAREDMLYLMKLGDKAEEFRSKY